MADFQGRLPGTIAREDCLRRLQGLYHREHGGYTGYHREKSWKGADCRMFETAIWA